MKTAKTIFLMMLVFAGFTVVAQEQPYQLTLQQAREYALEHNRSLMNAKDQITISKKKYWESVANGLPQIEGSLDYMTYFNYEMNFSFGSSGNTTINYQVLDEGDLEVLRVISESMGSSEPIIMSDQFSGKVQISQLIFSGQYYAGIKTARIAQKLADQSLIATELDIKENITNSYYNILSMERTLQILNENLKNLNEILLNTANLYKAGVAEETDVDQIKITVSQLKNSQKSLERMNQLNYNMLRFQMGVAPDVAITLTDNLDMMIGNIDTLATLPDQGDLTTNINYQLMESQVEITKKQFDMNKWAYAPTAAAFYSYTEKFKTTAFDMNPNHLAGFNVAVPIFSSGMRRAKVSQAKINLDIAQRNQEMLFDQLTIQQKQLLFNYQSALDNFNTQKEGVAIAKRVNISTENKFKQGMASSFDLTQANSNYLTAESNYVSSMLTLLQAQLSLDKLYNKL
jgi:outer membrane protein